MFSFGDGFLDRVEKHFGTGVLKTALGILLLTGFIVCCGVIWSWAIGPIVSWASGSPEAKGQYATIELLLRVFSLILASVAGVAAVVWTLELKARAAALRRRIDELHAESEGAFDEAVRVTTDLRREAHQQVEHSKQELAAIVQELDELKREIAQERAISNRQLGSSEAN